MRAQAQNFLSITFQSPKFGTIRWKTKWTDEASIDIRSEVNRNNDEAGMRPRPPDHHEGDISDYSDGCHMHDPTMILSSRYTRTAEA